MSGSIAGHLMTLPITPLLTRFEPVSSIYSHGNSDAAVSKRRWRILFGTVEKTTVPFSRSMLFPFSFSFTMLFLKRTK